MMQYGGAWLIGIGLLAWFARDAADLETRRAIVLAFLICYSIAFVVELFGPTGLCVGRPWLEHRCAQPGAGVGLRFTFSLPGQERITNSVLPVAIGKA